MRALGLLLVLLVVGACSPSGLGPAAPRQQSPLVVRSSGAYACRDADGPGGGVLFGRDYVGEVKVLEALGPMDLVVRTEIPVNVPIQATERTRFTPSSARSFEDLGVKAGAVLVVAICARAYDADRVVGKFKGFYFVAEVSTGSQPP